MSNFDNIGGVYAKDAELRQDIDDVKQLLGYEEEYEPQTKSRSANDTQYFTGIDVVSNGSTTLSADVVDSDARIQISDIADFVGYLSYLDGFSYKLDGVTPKLVNGRFFKNHNSSYGVVPVDSSLNTVNVDYSKDWEIGIAFMFEGDTSQESPLYGNTAGGYNASPYFLVGGTNGKNTAAVRVFDTSSGLWEIDPVIDTTLQQNKWYFLKVAYDASTATVTASTTGDFVNWNTVTETRAGKTPKTANQSAFAEFKSGYTMNQYCVIDFANTYIKQNDVMIWGHYDGAFAGENHYVNPAMPWKPLNDGYSNFWFELDNDTLSPWLNFSAKNNNATIDWGDGSGEVTLDTLTPTHTYSKAGRYIVKVKGVTGIGQQIGNNTQNDYIYCDALKNVELNNTVTSLSALSFRYCCGLKNIVFDEITTIGNSCFSTNSVLENISGTLNVASLTPYFTYINVMLKTFTLGTHIQTIGSYNFYGVNALTNITIPQQITSIGTYCFTNCLSLAEIHIQATTPPTLGNGCFVSLPSDYIIYVPVGYGETYKAAAGWSAYADHIVEEGETPTRAMLAKFNTDEPQDDMR